ncbi:hypothetical protein D3C84_1018870 [compost metagenome]
MHGLAYAGRGTLRLMELVAVHDAERLLFMQHDKRIDVVAESLVVYDNQVDLTALQFVV